MTWKIDREKCVGCGMCGLEDTEELKNFVEDCPVEAIYEE